MRQFHFPSLQLSHMSIMASQTISKACLYWPFMRRPHRWMMDTLHRGSVIWKTSPWHGVPWLLDMRPSRWSIHYNDVIRSAMASQITGVPIVCSAVCLSVDRRKHQSSVSLAFERGIHRWPMNSLHKGPVTRKKFAFDDIIIYIWFALTKVCGYRHIFDNILWIRSWWWPISFVVNNGWYQKCVKSLSILRIT